MIVGACAWIYGAAPLAETLERIAAAGCDGVELPGEPDQIRPADARALLARHRLTPVALTAACSAEMRRDLAHPDPAVRSDAVAYVVRCLRFAAECGVPLVQVLPSAETRLAPLAAREDEWRWSVEGVRAAAREAARLGVRLAVEPINRYEAYLVTSMAAALAYLDAAASPWVGVTLDLFHANIEEPAIPGAIRAAGPRLPGPPGSTTARRRPATSTTGTRGASRNTTIPTVGTWTTSRVGGHRATGTPTSAPSS